MADYGPPLPEPKMPNINSIEAVTVCVGYGDFLEVTAAWNRRIFDRWVIITEPDDKETLDVCRKYGLQAIVSKDARRGGGDFNKGRLVDRGLHHLSSDTWVVHLDADIILPESLRHYVRTAELQPDCIYGCDRVLVRSWEQWVKLRDSDYLQHSDHWRLNWPSGLGMGSRFVWENYGYVPIGFFQLWHSTATAYKGTPLKPYPQHHGNACRTDVQFALQWDRPHRLLLPEIVAVHLDSEQAMMGRNWRGRKTKRFGPPEKETGTAGVGSVKETPREAP